MGARADETGTGGLTIKICVMTKFVVTKFVW